MARRRRLTPEQLEEIAEAARRARTTAGWTEQAAGMPTDPAPEQGRGTDAGEGAEAAPSRR